MLKLHSLEEVENIILNEFVNDLYDIETVPVRKSVGRIIEEDIIAPCNIPPYNRSLVDGYAYSSSAAFGCSEAIPALLNKVGNVNMGELWGNKVNKEECVYVPTGGHVPEGCDTVVMIEDVEDYQSGMIGIYKPSAPGEHMVYKGEEMKEGNIIFSKGRKVCLKDIGILLACGVQKIKVRKNPVIGIISTGDELISEDEEMSPGKLRDINGPLFATDLENRGFQVIFYGVIQDEYELLKKYVEKAVDECDIVITSGGTSVGNKDVLPKIVEEIGELLVHGIAVKPGKPTYIGKVRSKPVFGLPGHPMAAYFIYIYFVQKLLSKTTGEENYQKKQKCVLAYAVSSNHGKESFIPVMIRDNNAIPIRGNSGMISLLSNAEGFLRIGRNSEGLRAGELVDIFLF